MGLNISEKMKVLDKLSDAFNKQKKEVSIGRIAKNKELEEKLKVSFIKMPSIRETEITGGGYPRGRMTIVAGEPDSGKTFSLLETIAKAQKENPDFIAGWLESEKSLTDKDLDMFGIDKERFWYQEFQKEGAAEESMDIVEQAIATGAIDMFVVNSLKCLVPSEELQKSMKDIQVGLQARFNSKMTKKLITVIAETNTAFIVVQHLTTNIGGPKYADPNIVAGGKAIRYAAVLITEHRKLSIGEKDPITREEGMKISVKVTKNHVIVDRFPYLKTEYYAIYGKGTEVYLEVLELAVETGLLYKTGAWIKQLDENGETIILKNGDKAQWNGMADFRNYCIANPDFFNELKDKVTGKYEYEKLDEEEIEEINKEEELMKQEIEKESKKDKKTKKKDKESKQE